MNYCDIDLVVFGKFTHAVGHYNFYYSFWEGGEVEVFNRQKSLFYLFCRVSCTAVKA